MIALQTYFILIIDYNYARWILLDLDQNWPCYVISKIFILYDGVG